jgi:putative oxidoreductase
MSPASRSSTAWLVLRLALAGLIAAHGWARWLAGAVDPFGVWLVSQGIPFGAAIAWGITGLEILGTLLFAAGRLVFPLSVLFACIYSVGIVMVHAKAGWFVVGLGRNGVEYSVLLITALLCVGAQHWPAKVRADQPL